MRAATVSVTGEKVKQCRHGGVICDGSNAFSLTELMNGSLQLPIDDNAEHEFVMVNDTGSPVSLLRLLFVGVLSRNTKVDCGIEGDAWQMFDGCMVTGNAADPPVQFTFSAGDTQGVPAGALFSIKVNGFSHCGQDRGYLTGKKSPGGIENVIGNGDEVADNSGNGSSSIPAN
jgi:hypothetical protein